MKKGIVVKCKFPHCLHETNDLKRDEAVRDGRSYYHPDCYQCKKDIEEIISLFVGHINANVPIAQLKKIVNTLIFERGVKSEYLRFAVSYAIANEIPLHNAPGLYSIVQDERVVAEWKRINDQKVLIEARDSDAFTILDQDEHYFEYNKKEVAGFGNVLI